MVKVSISLPNNTQITLESEESEVRNGIVGLVLRDLPRDLMQSDVAGGVTEKSTPSAQAPSTPTAVSEPPASSEAAAPTPAPARQQTGAPRSGNSGNSGDAAMPPEFGSQRGRNDFITFCQEASPLGDMRRVVVAAEGASRHFGVDGVNADDLGWLFDIAGWRRPGNFTQTLRNAARSKFGWLERIPGRSGRYAATNLGLSKTLPGGG